MAGRWYNLGLAIGLLPDELDTIKLASRDQPDVCLREMLLLWLSKTSPRPTRKVLIEALHQKTVGLEHLAGILEMKYRGVKQREPETRSAEVESDESTEPSTSYMYSRSHSMKKRKASDRSSTSSRSTRNSLPVKRPSASNEEPVPKRKVP